MSKDKETFVSRHGKRTPLEDVHEEQVVPPVKQAKKVSRRKLALKLPRLPKLRIRLSKRSMLIGGLVLVVVALSLLVAADSTKRAYERQTAAMKRSVTEVGLALPSADAKASAVTSSLLGGLKEDGNCKLSGIDVTSWYGPSKTARDDCRQTAKRYAELKSALTSLKDMSDYIEKVDKILSGPLAMPSDGAYAIPLDYANSWAQALHDLTALSSPAQLKNGEHKTLIGRTSAVAAAWQKLDQANSDNNAEQFKLAEKALGDAYTDFRKSGEDIDLIITQSQTAVSLAQSRL